MKRSTALLSYLTLVLSPPAAFSQISVRILEVPLSSFSAEPVYVVFEVRNDGPEPVVIPADTCESEGAFLTISGEGEPWIRDPNTSHCSPARLVWLPPNGRWLFLEGHALSPAGIFEIEAMLRSPGECQGALIGLPERPKIEPMRTEIGEKYECWSGEARSGKVFVEVSNPESEIDREAAEFLGLNPNVRWSAKQGIFKLRELQDRFPSSHITYAASWYGASALGLMFPAENQPDNPLNRFAAGAMEAQLAYLTRPCGDPIDKSPQRRPPSWWDRYEKFLAKHDPPQSMKDYAQQVKLQYAAEKCPEKKEETPPTQETGASAASTEQPAASSAGAASRQPQQVAAHPNASFGAGVSPNLAFKRRLLISPAPVARVFWISLPYRYTPADVGTPGVVDAEDLCQDIAEGTTAVIRWDEPTSTFVEHACGSPAPFPLVKGLGYAVRIAHNYSVGATFAGGHDNDFTFSIAPTGGSQLSWISLPYHLKRFTTGPGPFTAEDLCQQIGVAEVAAVVRWDETTNVYHTYACGSTFEQPFEIKRGTAYGVINKPGQTLTWQPDHF